MSYATNSDLLLEFKSLKAWDSNTLSGATVDEWCTQESNRIDGYICGKYSTPVDENKSPVAFSILKRICITFVKPRVREVLKIQTGEPRTSQGGGSSDPVKDALAELKSIQSGDMQLKDGVLATTADGAESYTNDNRTVIQPRFRRGDRQW